MTPENKLDPIRAKSHQSKWGYHACSYEEFVKLKFLHKHYWKTLRQFHRWHRWFRKEPQNRIGAEPSYCPHFVDNLMWVKPVSRHGEAGFKLYPRTVDDRGMVDLYRRARMPADVPVEAFSAAEIKKIDGLLRKVRKYVEQA